MKHMPLLLLSLTIAGSVYATAQAPEVLKIEGNEYFIHSNPLAPYLAANPGRLPEAEVTSSGLWRGYIGTWSVRDERLYLDDVRVPTKALIDPDAPKSKRDRSVMKALFGDDTSRVATWFTGHLIVPTGELIEYVHMGYGSTYSSYLILTIVEGAVQQRRELDAAAFQTFRRSQYQAFKMTPEYAAARAEATKGDEPMSDEMTEDFLYQFLTAEYMARIFEGADARDRGRPDER